MDRLTEITLKTSQLGGITANERDEWHSLYAAQYADRVWLKDIEAEKFARGIQWDNVRPIRKSYLSYLDHQAADRYLDAQRKPKVS